MHEESALLQFAHTLHWFALAFMGIVYIIRITWFVRRFKAGGERQASTGIPGYTTPSKGVVYSLGNVAMPWAMESSRKSPFFYVQFVAFHLGVTSAIALLFIIPLAPGLLESQTWVLILQIPIGAAFLVGIGRIIRRFADKYMRAISSPDDYFSLVMLSVWFAIGVMTQAHISGVRGFESVNILIVYLLLTSFFLLYVPFSKISHYLYYPFSRYWIGRALGHRGSMPYTRG